MSKTLQISGLMLRNDTSANWTANSSAILKKGEMGIEWNGSTPLIKIGDGTSTWGNLNYFTTGGSGVSITINGSGNSIVNASYSSTVDSSTGLESTTLTLTKGDRLEGVIANAELELDGMNVGHVTHTISQSSSSHSVEPGDNIVSYMPTVNGYGHVTGLETITYTLASLSVTESGTGNVVTGIDITGSDVTVSKGISVYTKTEVENLIDTKINPAMVLKGTLGTGGTITTLPTASSSVYGDTYKVITDGTYESLQAKVGDLISCFKASDDTYAWMLIPSGDDIEDTWREILVNGTSILGSAISSGPLNLVAGNKLSLVNNSGAVTFSHATISVSETTSASTASSFEVIDSITWDTTGHIASVNTKTVTIDLSNLGITSGILSWDNAAKTFKPYTTLTENAFYKIDDNLVYGGGLQATNLFVGDKEVVADMDTVLLNCGNASLTWS